MNIGIDFGTTNTSVTIINDGITFNYGEENYPYSSAIAIPKNDGKFIFGRSAKNKKFELSKDYTVITSIKSYLGTDTEFISGNKRYTPVEITAEFLKYIKNDIKSRVGIDITSALFSFPVDFSPKAREDFFKATQIADIKVNNFVNEATAGYMSMRPETKALSNVMVVDWGGGTLDISILDITENTVYENTIYGEKIGGDDIDYILAKAMHNRIVKKYSLDIPFESMPSVDKDNLIEKCEHIKINFSNEYSSDLMLYHYGELNRIMETISYNEFESIIIPVLKEKVLGSIDKAMRIAKKSVESINAIIVIGGSTKLKPFENAIINIFGKDKIILSNEPQWEVSKGSAILDNSNIEHILCDSVNILMSNDDIYEILAKDSKIGYQSQNFTFALIEDSPTANFIFTNSDNSYTYAIKQIKTKGFLEENLIVNAKINHNQIAEINILNDSIASEYAEKVEINKLRFKYCFNK